MNKGCMRTAFSNIILFSGVRAAHFHQPYFIRHLFAQIVPLRLRIVINLVQLANVVRKNEVDSDKIPSINRPIIAYSERMVFDWTK